MLESWKESFWMALLSVRILGHGAGHETKRSAAGCWEEWLGKTYFHTREREQAQSPQSQPLLGKQFFPDELWLRFARRAVYSRAASAADDDGDKSRFFFRLSTPESSSMRK